MTRNERNLPKSEASILLSIKELGQGSAVDIARRLYHGQDIRKKTSQVSVGLKRLEKKGYIIFLKKDGKRAIYTQTSKEMPQNRQENIKTQPKTTKDTLNYKIQKAIKRAGESSASDISKEIFHTTKRTSEVSTYLKRLQNKGIIEREGKIGKKTLFRDKKSRKDIKKYPYLPKAEKLVLDALNTVGSTNPKELAEYLNPNTVNIRKKTSKTYVLLKRLEKKGLIKIKEKQGKKFYEVEKEHLQVFRHKSYFPSLTMPTFPKINHTPLLLVAIIIIGVYYISFNSTAFLTSNMMGDRILMSLENSGHDFTYIVQNNYSLEMDNIEVSAQLSPDSVITDPGNATIEDNLIKWSLPYLAKGESQTFEFSATGVEETTLRIKGFTGDEVNRVTIPMQDFGENDYTYWNLGTSEDGWIKTIEISVSAKLKEASNEENIPAEIVDQTIPTSDTPEPISPIEESVPEADEQDIPEEKTESDVAPSDNATEPIEAGEQDIPEETEQIIPALDTPKPITQIPEPIGPAPVVDEEAILSAIQQEHSIGIYVDSDSEVNGNEILIGEMKLMDSWEGKFSAAISYKTFDTSSRILVYAPEKINVLVNSISLELLKEIEIEEERKIIFFEGGMIPESETRLIEATDTENEESEIINGVSVTKKTKQYGAVLGRPVKWKKKITLSKEKKIAVEIPKLASNITITNIETGQEIDATIEGKSLEKHEEQVEEILEEKLPKSIITGYITADAPEIVLEDIDISEVDSTELLIESAVTEIEIEYETPPPLAEETPLVSGEKQITIYSDYHYENILAFTEIPEADDVRAQLYHIENGKRTLVDIEIVDYNEDGKFDSIEWVVPHLSNQTYELSLTILNLQSYPELGGNWTVFFETTGTEKLNITKDEPTYQEISFDFLKCGDEEIIPTFSGRSIVVENWNCDNQIAQIEHTVNVAGPHEQKFEFGDLVEYAHNDVIAPTAEFTWICDCPGQPPEERKINNVACWGSGGGMPGSGIYEIDACTNDIIYDKPDPLSGLNLGSGYSGTLSTQAGTTISITGGLTIQGGTFSMDGSGAVSIGYIQMSSGTLTNTDDAGGLVLTSNDDEDYVMEIEGGTFNNNSGLVKVTGNIASRFLKATGVEFADLTIDLTASSDEVNFTTNLDVVGDLRVDTGHLRPNVSQNITVTGATIIENAGTLGTYPNTGYTNYTFGSLVVKNTGQNYYYSPNMTTITSENDNVAINIDGNIIGNNGLLKIITPADTFIDINGTSGRFYDITIDLGGFYNISWDETFNASGTVLLTTGRLKPDSATDPVVIDGLLNVTTDSDGVGFFGDDIATAHWEIEGIDLRLGSNFTSTSGVLELDGTSININNNFTHNSGTINLTAPGTGSFDPDLTSGTGLYNLEVSVGSEKTVRRKNSAINITINGDLTINSGTFMSYPWNDYINTTVLGNVVVNGGTLSGLATIPGFGSADGEWNFKSLTVGASGTVLAPDRTVTITGEDGNGNAIDIDGNYTTHEASSKLRIFTTTDTNIDLGCSACHIKNVTFTGGSVLNITDQSEVINLTLNTGTLNVSSNLNITGYSTLGTNSLFKVDNAAELRLSGNTTLTTTSNITFLNGKAYGIYMNNTNLTYVNGTNFVVQHLSNTPIDTGDFKNASVYVNMTNLSVTTVNLNMSYTTTGNAYEGTMRLYRYNTTDWVEISASGVDTIANILYGNLTEFSPIGGGGNTSSPPEVVVNSLTPASPVTTNDLTCNFTVSNSTTWAVNETTDYTGPVTDSIETIYCTDQNFEGANKCYMGLRKTSGYSNITVRYYNGSINWTKKLDDSSLGRLNVLRISQLWLMAAFDNGRVVLYDEWDGTAKSFYGEDGIQIDDYAINTIYNINDYCIIGGNSANLTRFTCSTGAIVWTRQFGVGIGNGIDGVQCDNTNCFAISGSGSVYKLLLDGTPIWNHTDGAKTPATGDASGYAGGLYCDSDETTTGACYIASANGHIVKMNKTDGTALWDASTGLPDTTAIDCIGSYCYGAHESGYISKVQMSDGAIVWGENDIRANSNAANDISCYGAVCFSAHENMRVSQINQNGKPLKAYVEWNKDGSYNNTITAAAINNTNTTVDLDSSYTTKDEQWTCTVIPGDTVINGTSKTSSSVTVLNTPPTAPTSVIAPSDSGIVSGSTTYLNWTNSTDADGDVITYYVAFNTSVAPDENDEFYADVYNYTEVGLIDGGQYYWRVKAGDGTENSSYSTEWDFTENLPPSLEDIIVDDAVTNPVDQIDLTGGGTRTINCTGVIYDFNGGSNVDIVTASFFNPDFCTPECGGICENDCTKCYINTDCTLTNKNSTAKNIDCGFEVYYNTKQTGAPWICTINANDTFNEVATQDEDITAINSLTAININSTTLDFGTLLPGENSSSAMNVTNYGNIQIDIRLNGTGMTCDRGSIDANNLMYNCTDPVNVSMATGRGTNLSSTITTCSDFDLTYSTDGVAPVTPTQDSVHWRMFLPPPNETVQPSGTCTGTIWFIGTAG